MIRPTIIHKQSPFLGEECALCKAPLSPGEEIVICPQDASRHHSHCWQANNNHCSAYGCAGNGELLTNAPAMTAGAAAAVDGLPETELETAVNNSDTQSIPRFITLSQGCLIIAIAIAIILFAAGCFGLWAIADYIMIDFLGWQYRAPLSNGLIPLFLNF